MEKKFQINQVGFDFIQEKHKECELKSETFRKNYEETGDPNVVIDFIRSSYFALHEKWVAQALDSMRMNGCIDLLAKAFLPWPGEKLKDKLPLIVENLEITIQVDKLYKQGLTKTEAFKQIAGHGGMGWESIKKRYYKTKESKPEVYVEVTNESISIKVHPTIIVNNGVEIPGQWEMIFRENKEPEIKFSIYWTIK